jgi:phosphoribosylaminoimidazolecarboxamide formyltransferase/IMP cyclohydrolase
VFAKKENLRLLLTGAMPKPETAALIAKPIAGGLLVQDRDIGRVTANDLKVVTKRQPSGAELADLLFAFTVCKHVKSNAIIYVREGATVGIGAGQMSRIDSARIAAWKAIAAAEAAGSGEPKTKGF